MKYRADLAKTRPDGAITWFTIWLGGPTLAKVENCRCQLAGEARVTAFITDEADTWFSQPAEINYKGCRIKGYITSDDEGYIFYHCYR